MMVGGRTHLDTNNTPVLHALELLKTDDPLFVPRTQEQVASLTKEEISIMQRNGGNLMSFELPLI